MAEEHGTFEKGDTVMLCMDCGWWAAGTHKNCVVCDSKCLHTAKVTEIYQK